MQAREPHPTAIMMAKAKRITRAAQWMAFPTVDLCERLA